MSSIPTASECLEILKKNGCSDEVVAHCKAVRDVAIKMAHLAKADIALVEAGALLHDIGRSKTQGIFHVVEGVEIAKKIGLPDKIVKIIERHIGGGISKQEAIKLGLPEKDYIPITLEEKIVCHSDSLIDNYKQQKIDREIEKALNKGHKEYASRLNALHKELSNICGIDLNYI